MMERKKMIGVGLWLLSLFPIAGVAAEAKTDKKAASSKITAEKHNLEHFTMINLSGVGDLYIKQSDQENLTVEADDSLLPLIKVYVKDKTLYLDLKDAASHTQAKIKYYLTIKDIQDINSYSSSTIYIQEGFEGDKLNIALNSFGEANIKVNVKKFTAKIEGGGRIEANGFGPEQEITIVGAGEFDGSKFLGKTATLHVSGSGIAKVDVVGNVAANGSGEAKIMYCGTPVISRQLTEKSTLGALDEKECK